MSKYGPIVLVEDDPDDKELFESAIIELGIGNELKWFKETQAAYDYLDTTDESVYLIFCDINLPGRNGIEFKRDVDNDPVLRMKSIPFLFYSTVAKKKDVNEAYSDMVVQGFFEKEHSYGRMKEMLGTIFHYWSMCKHPNTMV